MRTFLIKYLLWSCYACVHCAPLSKSKHNNVKDLVHHKSTSRWRTNKLFCKTCLNQNEKTNEKQEGRKSRYILEGSRWRPRNLTYRLSNSPGHSSIRRKDLENVVETVLQLWSEAANISFTKKLKGEGPVHINIRFASRKHGDTNKFDGRGKNIAHTYPPRYGGDIHLDNDEVWSVTPGHGVNLAKVLVHQVGHSLGLSHSDNSFAFMSSSYPGWVQAEESSHNAYEPGWWRDLHLHKDDIAAIQFLYGPKYL